MRVGGAYRYVWRGPDGKEMTSKGFYREVVPPERLVATERFEPTWYEGEAVNTTTFTEKNGKTTVTLTIQCGSKEIRDGILKSGMERGVAYSFDQLEQILASQTPNRSVVQRCPCPQCGVQREIPPRRQPSWVGYLLANRRLQEATKILVFSRTTINEGLRVLRLPHLHLVC